MAKLLSYLILLLSSILTAVAAPSGNSLDLSTSNSDDDGKPLLFPRQIITANPTVDCCVDCQDHYGAAKFQETFTDLCTWAGQNLHFDGPATYYTGDYYCPAPFDGKVCMHAEIQYLCGAGGGVTYLGCMGYFDFVINPPTTCGGPPFPGARVQSSDGCWIFQATADLLSQWKRDVEPSDLECDDDGRLCKYSGSNATAHMYVGPNHRFGPGPIALGSGFNP